MSSIDGGVGVDLATHERTEGAAEPAEGARDQAVRAGAPAASERVEAEEVRDEAVEARDHRLAAADDPLLDTAIRRLEARADEANPFGQPGQPLSARHPFRVGFTAALGVALAYALVQAAIGARSVLILLLVSAFLAIGLNPTVTWLERHGLPRKGAIAVVFAGVILFFVGFGLAVVPPVLHQGTEFAANVPHYLDRLQHNSTVNDLNNRYHVLDNARKYIQSGRIGTQAVGGVVGLGQLVLGGVFSMLTVLILTLYFLGSLPDIKATAYRLVPRSRRARVGLLADEILTKVGGYVAGALTIALFAGVSAFVFLLVAGTPYPLALAMLVAVTDLIPLIGATLGAIVVTLVCFTVSVPVGVACAVFFIVYQQVENYVIYPRVMGRSVDVNPAATIVAALLGGALLGVLGALLAIPSAAAIQLVLREVIMPRQDTY